MITFFTTITNTNNEELVKVGHPRNNRLNLFLSFNPFQYRRLINALEKLSYAELIRVSSYDDDRLRGGIGVRLLENNCFSKFIEELPILVQEHVELAEPEDIIHSKSIRNE
jgi:hypothetical protein